MGEMNMPFFTALQSVSSEVTAELTSHELGNLLLSKEQLLAIFADDPVVAQIVSCLCEKHDAQQTAANYKTGDHGERAQARLEYGWLADHLKEINEVINSLYGCYQVHYLQAKRAILMPLFTEFCESDKVLRNLRRDSLEVEKKLLDLMDAEPPELASNAGFLEAEKNNLKHKMQGLEEQQLDCLKKLEGSKRAKATIEKLGLDPDSQPAHIIRLKAFEALHMEICRAAQDGAMLSPEYLAAPNNCAVGFCESAGPTERTAAAPRA